MKVIICEECKKLCKTVNKSLCHFCYQLKRHLRSPLKKCECSEECQEMMHSVAKNGLKAKYKFGHFPKGKNSKSFKGGKIYNRSGGYISILKPDHPFCDSLGYVKEHRLIYEEYYNCMLLRYVDIHHINKIKTDNRIENLQPVYKKKHRHIHNIGNHKPKKKKHIGNDFCLLCGGKTRIMKHKNGYDYECWHRYNNGHICNLCYGRNRQERRY